ncbi:MAG: ankyrin repeat domain-containing protein [Phycisphaerales bacterium]|nr:ankyrin repeat domain-containing protein [Phycisphaerales bacterium]
MHCSGKSGTRRSAARSVSKKWMWFAVGISSFAVAVLVLECLALRSFPNTFNMQQAIERQNVNAVERLVRSGRDIDAPFDGAAGTGRTPLMVAARFAEPDFLEAMVERGANVSAQDALGHTPLHHCLLAVRTSSNADLKARAIRLIELGADTNARAQLMEGQTPLHYASAWRLAGVVSTLLRAGADPRIKDDRGRTALHLALVGPLADPAILHALLRAGADPDARDSHGKTPLHVAAEALVDPLLVSLLLEWGANPLTRDGTGLLPVDVLPKTDLRHPERIDKLRVILLSAMKCEGTEPPSG